eukprot:1466919-Pyramimonas_sp.AAC.1
MVKHEIEVGDDILFQPLDLVDHKAQKWRQKWAPSLTTEAAIQEAFRQGRERAELEPLPPITGADVREAARRMPARAGQ